MKIAYTAGMMREGFDGVTRVLYKWNENLCRKGIEHIFISADIPKASEQSVPMYEVHSVPFPLYKDYRVAVPTAKKFDAVLDSFKPDIIHFNSPCPLAYAALKYGRKHDIPVVSTYHTHFVSYATYYKLSALTEACWRLYHKLYGGCAQVYVPSLAIKDELSKGGLTNLIYLPHGVDTEKFNPGYFSNQWKIQIGATDTFVALYAGRLVWEKDVHLLPQISEALRRKYDRVKFVLAGDGPARTELEKRMPDAVFLGHLSSQHLAQAYASSDVLVFPSRTETFGNVTLEAMACGTVPICAAAGGAQDLIINGINGFSPSPGDVNGFVRAIEHVMYHPNRRAKLVENAFHFAQEQSWEAIIDRLLRCYSVATGASSANAAA
ncbi:MAG TPA: glycosyltransferase family 1 protein [Bacteroidota bacterium]|nr:glycosyltransferase family 1 protein [Bacteroidota bacterium]